jgi:hypothetical protein
VPPWKVPGVQRVLDEESGAYELASGLSLKIIGVRGTVLESTGFDSIG